MSVIEQIERSLSVIDNKISSIIEQSDRIYDETFIDYELIEGIDSEGGKFRILKGKVDSIFGLDYSTAYQKEKNVQELIAFYNQNQNVIDLLNQKIGDTLLGQERSVSLEQLRKHESDLNKSLKEIEFDSNNEFEKKFEIVDENQIILKDKVTEYIRLTERKASLEKLRKILIDNKDVITDYETLMKQLDELLENPEYIKIEKNSGMGKTPTIGLKRVDRYNGRYENNIVQPENERSNVLTNNPNKYEENNLQAEKSIAEISESAFVNTTPNIERPKVDIDDTFTSNQNSVNSNDDEIVIDIDDIPVEEIVPPVYNTEKVEEDPVLAELMLNEQEQQAEKIVPQPENNKTMKVVSRRKVDSNTAGYNEKLIATKGVLAMDFSPVFERPNSYKKYRLDISKFNAMMYRNDYLTNSGKITDLTSQINSDVTLSRSQKERLLLKIQDAAIKLENAKLFGMLSDSSKRGL